MRSFFLCCLLFFLCFTSRAENVFSSFVQFDEFRTQKMVWVVYDDINERNTRIRIKDVFDELPSVLSDLTLYCIKSFMDSEGMLSFEELKKCDLSSSVDLTNLEITISSTTKGRKENKISVSFWDQKKKKARRPNWFSGYFNLRGLRETASLAEEPSSSGNAEAVINFGGLVFESRFTYLKNPADEDSTVNRDYSRITYDFEERMSRFILGDINNTTRGFQNRINGFGISYNKEFSINPRFFRTAFRNYKIFIDHPSTIEIFVNNRLVKTERVPKGPLEIDDFPFVSGENVVRIRVISDFGEVKEVDFSSIADSRILSEGVSDYAVSWIFPRKNDLTSTSIQDSYFFEEGVLSGFYHRGIKDNLVLGFESQIGNQGGLLGLESVYGNKLGVSKFNLVTSVFRDEMDTLDLSFSNLEYAFRLENESLLMKKGALRNFRLNTALELQTKDFTTYDTNNNSQHKLLLRASVAQNFRNAIRGSLGFSKAWGHDSKNDQTLVFSNFGWNFHKNWNLSSSIKLNLDNEEDSTILLSLAWSTPVQNTQWISTFDPQNEAGTTELTYFPIRDTNNLKIRTGGNLTANSETVSGGIEYLNQRLELKANYTSTFMENQNDVSISSVSAGTGIAFAGSHIAITRPIANSFAIIGMSKKPFGLRVPIDRYGMTKRAEINLLGPAIINTLAPYFKDQISVDTAAIPYGLTVKNESFNFKPTYKSGVYLDIGVESKTSIIGQIRRRDGGEVSYLSGRLIEVLPNGKEKVVSDFFTGSDGSFNIEGIKSKNYFIDFQDSDTNFKRIGIKVEKTLGFYQLKEPLILIKESR